MTTDMQAAEARQGELWFQQSVSVFFPAFNDAPSIAALVEAAAGTLSRLVPDFEIIVVDDGSTDATPNVLRELRRVHPCLRVVTHDRNLGYGAALRSGFLAASKQYIFYTDGDGQYDPRELELMLDAATPGVGLVNGYKVTRNDPPHRVAIGWLYNCFARSLFGIGYP